MSNSPSLMIEEPELIVPRQKKGYDYVRKGILGHGVYGSVYLCMRQGVLDSNPFTEIFYGENQYKSEFCAIKTYRKFNQSDQGYGVDVSSLRQITILLSIEHPNLLCALQVIADKEDLKVVMEYQLQLKDLLNDSQLMKQERNKKMICYQMIKGLAYLHKNHIFHRDLKPENILASKDGLIKIGDFGLSKYFGFANRQYTPGVCTPHFRAPELFFSTKFYNQKIDIWSLGCIIFAIFNSGATLFESDGYQVSTLTKIFSITGTPTNQSWKQYEKLPQYAQFQPFPKKNLSKMFGISEEVSEFIDRCLQLDPKKRPSAQQLLNDKFFDNDREFYENKKLNIQYLYDRNLQRELLKKTF